MKFNCLKNYLFEQCSVRVNHKMSLKGVSNLRVYPTESKLIGYIRQCKTDPIRNPYLLTPNTQRALEEELQICTKELLWGTDSEIKTNLLRVFEMLIFDLISEDSPHRDFVNSILCRYVPYARYSAYNTILFIEKKVSPEVETLFYEDKINFFQCADNFTIDAIIFLFDNCKQAFYDEYKLFTNETNSYTRLDSTLTHWVESRLLKFLNLYENRKDSIGKRIETLIQADNALTLKCYETSNLNYFENEALSLLHSATERYIEELELIQKFYPHCTELF